MGCIFSKHNAEQAAERPPPPAEQPPPPVEEGNYRLQYLREITDNFSHSTKIGHGGFGMVYKGTLDDGSHIAVKKLTMQQSLSLDNHILFRNEVTNLMGLEHTNIVRLLGYCYYNGRVLVRDGGRLLLADVEERMLCFEFLTKGSLDKILLDQSRGFEWDMHFKIIQGISSGLHYLHDQSHPIVHLDLKPSNILLDNNMTSKIADFGLSRLFGTNVTKHYTSHVAGTKGYMSPELLRTGKISTKADVYSFGIMILEILTGESVIKSYSLEQYIERVRRNWSSISQISSRYPALATDCLKEVTGCIDVAIKCVDTDPAGRPSAEQICYMLNKLSQLKDGQIFIMDEASRKLGYILCARALSITWSNNKRYWRWHSHYFSRFKECALLIAVCWFHVSGEIPTRDLYVGTTYKVYLLFRRRKECSGFSAEQASSIRLAGGRVLSTSRVCLDPGISLEDDVNYPSSRPDGWMEVELGEFATSGGLEGEKVVIADVYNKDDYIWKQGIYIEGMEFRPQI